VIFDPPYGISWCRSVNDTLKKGKNVHRLSKAHPGIANDHDTSVRDWVLSQMPGKPSIVFGSFYAPYPADIRQVLVWHKPDDSGVIGSATGFRRNVEPIFLVGKWPRINAKWSSLLRSERNCMKQVAMETGHPHTKPVDLIARFLSTILPKGTIADPCMGSGSTLVAAKSFGRNSIGVEMEERYCETAANRLRQSFLQFDNLPAPPPPPPTPPTS
jgi:hypothetical protein